MKLQYLLIISCLLGTTQLVAQRMSLEKAVWKVVKNEVYLDKNPGLVIGIIEGDSSYVFSFGEEEKGTGIAPNGNTIFEIGSVSKVFTATVLAIMEQEGSLSYNDSLSKYFPEKLAKDADCRKITLKNLATHSSTLPRLPFDFGIKQKEHHNPYIHYSDADLWAYLNEYTFIESLGKYNYSHINYALLGKVLEVQSKQKLADLMQEKLLQKLDMTDTAFDLNEEQKKRLSKGYSVSGDLVPPWTVQCFEASIGMKSTTNDLLKFVEMQLGQSDKELGEICAKTHEPQYSTIKKKVHVGIGWHVVKPKKRFYNVIAHSGATGGHQVYVGFVKETGTGVVVLSNSENNLDGLGGYILRMINKEWKRKK